MKTRSGSAGFSLVEVAMALGIVSFALIALIGLTNTALRSTAESSKSIDAANAASQIVARWSSTLAWNSRPGTETPTAQPGDFPLSISIPEAGQSVSGSDILINGEGNKESLASGQKFRLEYKIDRSSQTPGMVRLHLRLSWPPQAPVNSAVRSNYEIVTGVLLGSS